MIVRILALFALLSFLAACTADKGSPANGQSAVPAECSGYYFDVINGLKYYISDGSQEDGGVMPGHCAQYARPFKEMPSPLPKGYIECRKPEGQIIGMKPATCTREGGTILEQP